MVSYNKMSKFLGVIIYEKTQNKDSEYMLIFKI